MKSMGIVLSFSTKATGIFAWSLVKKKEKEKEEKGILLQCI